MLFGKLELFTSCKVMNARILRSYGIMKKSQGVDDILFVHGGASNFEDDIKEAKLAGVKEAAREGFFILQKTGSILDGVDKAVRIMEDNDIFNAVTLSNRVDDILFVHGGASNFEDDIKEAKLAGVKEAAREGLFILQKTGSVLDGVDKAVRIMEDNDISNAARDSEMNEDDRVEMDVSVMLGSDLSAGGVAAVKDVRLPIEYPTGAWLQTAGVVAKQHQQNALGSSGALSVRVARKVMEKSLLPVLLSGEGAFIFAKNLGLELAMPGGLVTKRARKRHKNKTIFDQKELGTVGAIGLCKLGYTAAATSSGGRSWKKAGRVGHACRSGCGIMADDLLGAVAATGHGESIVTMCLANTICKALDDGSCATETIRDNLKMMRNVLHNNGGGIVITKNGELGIFFTTKRMPYAYVRSGTLFYGGVDKNDETSEDL